MSVQCSVAKPLSRFEEIQKEVNGTRFVVQEIATIETSENGIIQLPLGQIGTGELWIKNSGNVPLSTTWSIGSLPLGWVGGFQSIVPATLDMNREANVIVGVEVSGNIPVGMTDVTVPVIVEAVTPGLEIITHTFEFSVEVCNVMPPSSSDFRHAFKKKSGIIPQASPKYSSVWFPVFGSRAGLNTRSNKMSAGLNSAVNSFSIFLFIYLVKV